ncbi:hypothetical protein IT417_00840 [bacterium]|nr:hypothetical protein [bacterium]
MKKYSTPTLRFSEIQAPQGIDVGLVPEAINYSEALKPFATNYTHSDIETILNVAARRPNTEFPLFMEQVNKCVIERDFGPGTFNSLNPVHRIMQDFMRRWYAAIDHIYDMNMAEFDRNELSNKDFIEKIYESHIIIPNVDNFENEYTIAQLTNLLRQIINDPGIYKTIEERNQLSKSLNRLMTYTINISLNLPSKNVNRNIKLVKSAKLGIHASHGGLMFDMSSVSLIKTVGFAKARKAYIQAKKAHQIKNDFLGILEDSESGAANLFLGLSNEFGEWPSNALKNSDLKSFYDSKEYSEYIKKTFPKTSQYLLNLQRKLLSNVGLNSHLKEICLLPIK